MYQDPDFVPITDRKAAKHRLALARANYAAFVTDPTACWHHHPTPCPCDPGARAQARRAHFQALGMPAVEGPLEPVEALMLKADTDHALQWCKAHTSFADSLPNLRTPPDQVCMRGWGIIVNRPHPCWATRLGQSAGAFMVATKAHYLLAFETNINQSKLLYHNPTEVPSPRLRLYLHLSHPYKESVVRDRALPRLLTEYTTEDCDAKRDFLLFPVYGPVSFNRREMLDMPARNRATDPLEIGLVPIDQIRQPKLAAMYHRPNESSSTGQPAASISSSCNSESHHNGLSASWGGGSTVAYEELLQRYHEQNAAITALLSDLDRRVENLPANSGALYSPEASHAWQPADVREPIWMRHAQQHILVPLLSHLNIPHVPPLGQTDYERQAVAAIHQGASIHDVNNLWPNRNLLACPAVLQAHASSQAARGRPAPFVRVLYAPPGMAHVAYDSIAAHWPLDNQFVYGLEPCQVRVWHPAAARAARKDQNQWEQSQKQAAVKDKGAAKPKPCSPSPQQYHVHEHEGQDESPAAEPEEPGGQPADVALALDWTHYSMQRILVIDDFSYPWITLNMLLGIIGAGGRKAAIRTQVGPTALAVAQVLLVTTRLPHLWYPSGPMHRQPEAPPETDDQMQTDPTQQDIAAYNDLYVLSQPRPGHAHHPADLAHLIASISSFHVCTEASQANLWMEGYQPERAQALIHHAAKLFPQLYGQVCVSD
jgi:hypothetical protein